MQALATYIMRGRIQAGGIIGLFGALAILLPLFSYVSNAALGLVVLRKGPKEGMIAMTGAMLLCGIVSYVRFNSPVLALTMALAFWLPVWLASQVLRATRSQTILLIAATIMALVFSIGMRTFVVDVEGFWHEVLNKIASHAEGVDAAKRDLLINKMAVLTNGFVAGGLGLSIMVSTLLARWWQSNLYNPGGFGEEFRGIQLPKLIALPVIACLVVILTGKVAIPPYGLLLDIAIIGLLAFMFHGLSVVHYFVKKRNLNIGWIIGLYFFLILASLYAVCVLALTGIVDSFTDFRKLRTNTTQ